MTIQNKNPATDQTLEEYKHHTEDQLHEIIEAANNAYLEWSETSIEQRQLNLEEAANYLEQYKTRLSKTITREMGKPIKEAEAEVEKCAWVCRYYAEKASEHLQDQVIGGEIGAKTYVRHEPLGTVLAVMPWNYPFWQVFRFAAPNLAAGNTGVLKHASNVPGCALAIESVFQETGFPEDVFRSLLIPGTEVENAIKHPDIKAVTLTGSNRAGEAVAKTAGEEIKKTVLELGGSDPFLVLDDADVDHAAKIAAKARNINTGQSCIAAKRHIVHRDVHDDFLDKLVRNVESLKVGDPMDSNTDIGPIAREDLRDGLHSQVTESINAGAELHTGGEPIDRDGYYYKPTVLSNVPLSCPAGNEEIFGPVGSVFKADSVDEMIEYANSSIYGLGASIWTQSPERGEELSHDIEAGMVYINELVKSDPRLPFGGVKKSGYGRELGPHGIKEFTNEKTIWVSK